MPRWSNNYSKAHEPSEKCFKEMSKLQEALLELRRHLNLAQVDSTRNYCKPCQQRNICVVLGCLAEKMAGKLPLLICPLQFSVCIKKWRGKKKTFTIYLKRSSLSQSWLSPFMGCPPVLEPVRLSPLSVCLVFSEDFSQSHLNYLPSTVTPQFHLTNFAFVNQMLWLAHGKR